MVPAFLRETDGSYLYKDGSQHSLERQMVPTCARMVPRIPERDKWFLTCTRMLPSIPERDKWILSVQGRFPAFLRETVDSYLYKDGS